jgi:hypothetical protein
MSVLRRRFPLVLAAIAAAAGAPTWPASPSQEARTELREALGKEGIQLDLEAGVLSVPASVLIKNDLLEYLLVGPNGAMHESLFLTSVRPSLLNAALLLFGVEPGRNASWEEPAASGGDESERGEAGPEIRLPEGDGFYLYAAWREAGETYFFRVEDLVRNLASGRSLRRHRWVYLGSRFFALKPGQPESFLADVEGNLINLSFFFQGNTLLTAAVPECYEQTIWAANEWLLPERAQPVRLFFARAPLERLASEQVAALPEARTGSGDAGEGDAETATDR